MTRKHKMNYHSPISPRVDASQTPSGKSSKGRSHKAAKPPKADGPDAAILKAYAAWSAKYDEIGLVTATLTTKEEEDRIAGPLFDEMYALEVECCKLQPMTARGLAVQIMCFTNFGEFELEASRQFDMEAKIEALAAIERPEGLRPDPKEPSGSPSTKRSQDVGRSVAGAGLSVPMIGSERCEKRIARLSHYLAANVVAGVDPQLVAAAAALVEKHAKLERAASADWDESTATAEQRTAYARLDDEESDAQLAFLSCPTPSGSDQAYKAEFIKEFNQGADIMNMDGSIGALLEGMLAAGALQRREDRKRVPDLDCSKLSIDELIDLYDLFTHVREVFTMFERDGDYKGPKSPIGDIIEGWVDPIFDVYASIGEYVVREMDPPADSRQRSRYNHLVALHRVRFADGDDIDIVGEGVPEYLRDKPSEARLS